MRAFQRTPILFLALMFFGLGAAVPLADEGPAGRPPLPLPTSIVPVDRMELDFWRERHEANKARIAEGNVDLLLLGDSITHFWDTAGREVEEYYYGDRNCVNMGIASDRTEHLLWRLGDLPMDKIHPKAAMLLIGHNNLWVNTPQETVLGIKANVDKLHELFPGMPILVLKIFPGGDKKLLKRIAEVNALITEQFQEDDSITLMDLSDLWVDRRGKIIADRLPDTVHPSELGYKLWGAAVEPVLAEMLGAEEKPKMK